MQVDLSSNFFDLFGLSVGFSVDESTLIERFRELQKQLHPDKYASASDAERRWSMQAASFVNEGYQTLGDDLKRAIYLLGLNGISTDEETDTQMAPDFLMEQMEYREALEAASSAADPYVSIDKVRKQLRAGVKEQYASFDNAAQSLSWDKARTVVRQWQFLDKLGRELKYLEERLDE
ncbi:MAG: Fe-S protein assembly co-chaperone HscB [Granulosicoccus sp.]